MWTVIRNIEHWSEWTPTVTSIRALDSGPLAVGTRALVRQPKLLPAQWRVTEIGDGRGFTWIMRGLGVLVTARHRVEAVTGGSRATLSLDFSGPLGPIVPHLTRGLNSRYLALEAQGLKQRAETDSRLVAAEDYSLGGSR